MLFTTTEQLKEYLPISVNLELDDLKPYIKSSEDGPITLFLSSAQLGALQVAFDADPDGGALGDLLKLVRYPLAHMAVMKWSYVGDKSIGKAGIMVQDNDQQKVASQWRLEDLRAHCLREFDEGIERMLEHLEANKINYSEWASSSACTTYESLFLKDAREFNEQFNINSSRRTFLAFMPAMKRVEELAIKSIMGTALFDELKAQIAAGTTTANNLKLLPIIKPAVACLAAARGMVENTCEIDGAAVVVRTQSTSLTQNINQAPIPALISARIQQAERDGLVYQEKLKKFLFENHSDYPLYEADDTVYITDSTKGDPNESDRGVFMI